MRAVFASPVKLGEMDGTVADIPQSDEINTRAQRLIRGEPRVGEDPNASTLERMAGQVNAASRHLPGEAVRLASNFVVRPVEDAAITLAGGVAGGQEAPFQTPTMLPREAGPQGGAVRRTREHRNRQAAAQEGFDRLSQDEGLGLHPVSEAAEAGAQRLDESAGADPEHGRKLANWALQGAMLAEPFVRSEAGAVRRPVREPVRPSDHPSSVGPAGETSQEYARAQLKEIQDHIAELEQRQAGLSPDERVIGDLQPVIEQLKRDYLPVAEGRVSRANDLRDRPSLMGSERGGLGTKKGKGGVTMMSTIAGAGTGGAAGYASSDKDDSTTEKVLRTAGGVVLGAGAGALGGRVMERIGERGAAPMATERPSPASPGRVEDFTGPRTIPKEAGDLSTPPAEPPPPVQAADLNRPMRASRLGLPPRLEEQVAGYIKPIEEANARTVPHAQVTAEAARIMGADPALLRNLDPNRITGAEMTAVAQSVRDNQAMAGQLSAEFPKASPARQAEITQALAHIDADQQVLLKTIVKGGSQQGRDLNANKILAQMSNDPVHWMLRGSRLADRPLTDVERDTITRLAGQGKRDELLRFMGRLRQATRGQKALTAWKSGLLTNPATHAVNITGNTTQAVFEDIAQNPAAIADWFASKFTKLRTKTFTTRNQLRAEVGGLKEGAKQFGQVMRGLPVGEDVTLGRIPMETYFKNPIANAYFNGPFRLLNAEDKIFSAAAYRKSIAEQAELRAGEQGLKGKAYSGAVQDMMKSPSDEMHWRATQDAMVRTFRDETMAGEALAALQNKLGVVGQVFVPFTKTPGAIATRVAESTPYGVVKGGVNTVRAIRAIRKVMAAGGEITPELKRMQQVAAEQLGRGAVGSGALAAGYVMGKMGLIQGGISVEDKGARETSYLTGEPQNALRIGDTRIELARTGVVGMLLSMGATLAQLGESGGTVSERAGQTVGALSSMITDQPFLTGIQNILDLARNPVEKGKSVVPQMAGSLVPAWLSAVARATDPNIRVTDGAMSVIQSRIPGLSQQLPVKPDQLGQPARRQAEGWLNNLLNPAKTSRSNRDPIVDELRRTGAQVTTPRREKGETAADYAARLTMVGEQVRGQLAQLVSSPEYQDMGQQVQQYRTEILAAHPEWKGLSVEALTKRLQANILTNTISQVRSSVRGAGEDGQQ